MSNIERKPKIRFPEFTDAWEQRKLGDVADIVGGGTPNTSIAEYWNGDINWFAPAEIGEQIYVESSNRKITKVGLDKCSAKILPIGTVLFTSRAGIGNTAILAKEACTNQGFQSIIPKEGLLDSYFIYSRSNELKKYGETVGAGSTFVEVSGKQMSKMDISLPKIYEQRKIGSYFNQLDNLITLHQRKLEILKRLKKGFLQKLFPQKDNRVPELRFPGFSGDWKQCKLGDVTDSYSGGTPTVGKNDYYGGNIPFIRSAEINSKSTELFITEKGLKNSSAKMVSKGTILYALYGATSGECGISQINGAINQAILAIIPKNNFDSYFITTWLRRSKSEIISTYLQGGQGNLSGAIVKNLILKVPSINEQKTIGTYFEQLDNLITLHQRKLEILQNIKKGFLQQMFV